MSGEFITAFNNIETLPEKLTRQIGRLIREHNYFESSKQHFDNSFEQYIRRSENPNINRCTVDEFLSPPYPNSGNSLFDSTRNSLLEIEKALPQYERDVIASIEDINDFKTLELVYKLFANAKSYFLKVDSEVAKALLEKKQQLVNAQDMFGVNF